MADAGFSPADFRLLGDLVIAAWNEGIDRDWSVPAGTLDWNCFDTADHTIDCVFAYALMLGSLRQDSYPNFSELHALPGSDPTELVDGLRAVTTMLYAVVIVAAPSDRAIIWRFPEAETATPVDFAARGGLELILHAHDVCSGLGVSFDPPRDLCQRLLIHTEGWPGNGPGVDTGDSWADLLGRHGRGLSEARQALD